MENKWNYATDEGKAAEQKKKDEKWAKTQQTLDKVAKGVDTAAKVTTSGRNIWDSITNKKPNTGGGGTVNPVNPTPPPAGKPNNTIWWVVGGVLAVGVVIGVIMIVKKK